VLPLLLLACFIQGSSPAGCQRPRAIPTPNWNEPTPEAQREAAEADARPPRAPGPHEIAFSFTLPEKARGTSAGVYDAQDMLVRTLWSARPYGAGSHNELWSGKDDQGNTAPAGVYRIKVLYGNVHYDWDGVLGVTEDSLAGPHNWDATAAFPSSLAFIGDKAYVAGGYNEARIEAYVFDEKTPYTVAPLNMALFSGGQFEFAASDGKRVYFAAMHYCCGGSNAVVSLTPDGKLWDFAQGTVIPSIGRLAGYFVNTQMQPPVALLNARGVDVGPFQTEAITGLAVERQGKLLATAHGAHGGAIMKASLDSIYLWDKNTGARVGTIEGIHSPQKMAFDLDGDLWVVEGGPVVDWHWDRGARLARIHDAGGKNEITEPIAGLENPVDVKLNPANGHLLVADGGASQQVKEFDPRDAHELQSGKPLSTLGTHGGYGQGDACNATLTSTSFWLDFNWRSTGITQPWIAVDESGDVWVGDFTASRMMQFHLGRLVHEIQMGRYASLVSVPRNSPTRVFGGWHGMLEYAVNYNGPLLPQESTAPIADAKGNNSAWKAVRNWYPCFLQAEAGQQDGRSAQMVGAETLADGQTFGMVMYHGGPFSSKNALVTLPETGRIGVVNNRITVAQRVWLDPAGNYYRSARGGTKESPDYTINRFAITGFDARGFPQWDSGTAIGSLKPNLANGDPVPNCWYDGCDFMPTAGGVIPIYDATGTNKNVATGAPAFHFGGLPVNGAALAWETLPEKPITYPDGRGSYATMSATNVGNGAHAIGHDVFAGINGNWQQFSCQYFHYRDDGLLVGQFGWRASDAWPGIGRLGHPNPMQGDSLAPGFCGNPIMFKLVQVGSDDYIYNADEAYRAGIHRWHISNLGSVHELAGETDLGGTVRLVAAP
jgi:hypothetical protein